MDTEIAHPVLILFAHPAIRKSRVNRRLVAALRDLDGVTVNDLYDEYPDLNIDVSREQELLLTHGVVVFQHPFFWYSTPAILKEWQDLVLEHGWAYGHDGDALRDKTLLNAITTGASEDAYCAKGSNRFSVRQLLAPIEQTARLCGMDYIPPFVVHGTFRLTDREIDDCAIDYRRLIEGLRDGRVTAANTVGRQRINADLDSLLEG